MRKTANRSFLGANSLQQILRRRIFSPRAAAGKKVAPYSEASLAIHAKTWLNLGISASKEPESKASVEYSFLTKSFLQK